VRVRVDHAGHDGEARAVQNLTLCWLITDSDGDDPPLVHDDVGAGELPRADVDEPVAEDDQVAVGSIAVAGAMPAAGRLLLLAMSITASDAIGRLSSVRGNPSKSRTFAERATATMPT
jgi:hypothetical protein